MGICASTENLSDEQESQNQKDKLRSRNIDAQLEKAEKDERNKYKLLLLGPGESGKSTFFKQMTEIYGSGYPEECRKSFICHINRNTINAIKALCQACDKSKDWNVNSENKNAQQIILNTDEEKSINVDLGSHMKELWKDPGILQAYQNRNQFQLEDSAGYYLDRLEDIMQPDYIPTKQDVFRSRVSTTGIIAEIFKVDGHQFQIFDVGGQRSERKKWIHCFENVTAVLFMAALSAYDQMLYEDEDTNRMREALELFQEISNSPWFEDTAMILFLNKKDLFEEKLKISPLENFFPEYKGKNEYDEATKWIIETFEQQQSERQNQEIYTHLTCATDTQNIFVVSQAVKDIVIKNALKRAGLM